MKAEILNEVLDAFNGNSGDATVAVFKRLHRCGAAGSLAVSLYQAIKASQRAKLYRGRFKGVAYDKKNWAIEKVADALLQHAEAAGISWGWGYDAKAVKFEHVIYIDLPTGQVSLHTSARKAGPEYPGQWDGVVQQAPIRLCRWITTLLEAA